MEDDLITIENDGMTLQMTNYYDTKQAQRGEVFLSWNAGCGRLLIPSSQRHLLTEMKCDHVIVTKKKDGIEILFDDLTDFPFRLLIAHEQNDSPIEPGKCLFSVYIKLGEKYQFPCECIIEHGNKGNTYASKDFDGHLNIRCKKRDKAGWVKQAQRDGYQNLTEFVHAKLNAAVDDDLK